MFIKKQKHPSPPFTRNYLTHKTLSKKVKGEGLKTLFYTMYAWVKEKRVKSKKYPRVKNRKNPKKRI